ncbi:hypothetical protein DERF_005060 [Dermatophagoides farinae]|uniref:CCHC-type domain-containing protein n=1 Tax=Dermatophagoides farinae TaxID=6954 RepID=A0A922I541_DERFA|nr:hypothetical protein DERF_005060 [Dermatophagoides farinae]
MIAKPNTNNQLKKTRITAVLDNNELCHPSSSSSPPILFVNRPTFPTSTNSIIETLLSLRKSYEINYCDLYLCLVPTSCNSVVTILLCHQFCDQRYLHQLSALITAIIDRSPPPSFPATAILDHWASSSSLLPSLKIPTKRRIPTMLRGKNGKFKRKQSSPVDVTDNPKQQRPNSGTAPSTSNDIIIEDITEEEPATNQMNDQQLGHIQTDNGSVISSIHEEQVTDQRQITTVIEKVIGSPVSDSARNSSYAKETDIQFVELILKETMQMENIREDTKTKLIVALKTVRGLQAEVSDLRNKLISAEQQLASMPANREKTNNAAIYEQLKCMKETIDKFAKKFEATSENPIIETRSSTFADVVKKSVANKEPLLGTVISMPNNEDAEQTRRALANKIIPAAHGIVIKETAALSKGKFMVKFATEDNKKKFDELVRKDKDFIAEDQRKRNPIIYLKGVRVDIKKEDIPDMIGSFNVLIKNYMEEQNLELGNCMEICFDRRNKQPTKFWNYGLRVDSGIRDIIINKMSGRVNIDYSYVHAEDLNPLHQCYNCYGFHHHAADCREPQPVCPYCADAHDFADCPNRRNEPACINCYKNRIKHTVSTMDNHRQTVNQIKFAQLNTNHSPSATTAFINYCNSKNIDIAIISEPPIKQGLPNIPNRLCPMFVAPVDNNQRVRACMCILNPKIQPIIISHLSTPDFIVCDFNNLIVVSVYAHPVDSIIPILNNITNVANYANGRDFIIAGDMNANNRYWGADYNDKHGDELLAAIIQCNLEVMNNSNKPTFDTIRGNNRLTSHIDLTLASMSTSNMINNWHVIDDIQMSDHRAIVFDINKNYELPKIPPSTVRWNTSDADWETWAQCLENHLNDYDVSPSYIENIEYVADLDATVNAFISSIRWACEENLVKYNRNRKRRLPWSRDDELNRLTNEQKKIYRKINKCYNQVRKAQMIDEYRNLRLEYRKRVETLKESSCEKKSSVTFSDSNGPQDTVDTLLKDLFPDDVIINDTTEQANVRNMVDNWKQEHAGIRNGFNPIMAFFPETLVAIMNACLRLSYFPYVWKISVVKIIPKPGRPTYDKSSSYRPIGLLPILAKALEAVMANRIKSHLEANCPLSVYQYVVPISRKIRPVPIPAININGHDLVFSDEAKVLGVIIDKKMDFRSHLRYAITKATKIYRQLLGFARMKYGLGSKIIKRLYESIIVPIITYGCAIWCRAASYVHMQKELRQFQRPIAQLVTKSYRTAAFVSTTAIADMVPLYIEIMEQAKVSLARITRKYHHGGKDLIVDIPDETRVNVTTYPVIYHGQSFARTYCQVYTKIIRTRFGIGCGFQLFNGTYFIGTVTHRLPTFCSNLQADLFIILKAVNFCKEKYSSTAPITILNNNIGAINHMKKKDHNKLLNLAKQIIGSTPNNISITWIKVDRSDEKQIKLKKTLKSAARVRPGFDYEQIPMVTVKKLESCASHVIWDRQYRFDRYGTSIKTICPNVGDARQFWPYINFWLTQTLTGHGQFGAYLKRFGFIDNPKCPCGDSNQTVSHMINECQLAARLRHDHMIAKQNTNKPAEKTRITAVLYEQLAMLVDTYRNNLHHENSSQRNIITDNDHGYHHWQSRSSSSSTTQISNPQVTMPIPTGHDFQNFQFATPTTATPRPAQFLASTANLIPPATSTRTPITTTISRCNTPTANVNNQPLNNDLSFLKDTLSMANTLKGNITTSGKHQIIEALQRAVKLLAENIELKAQLVSVSKRKRHDTDIDPRNDMMDDENDYVTKTEMKEVFGDIKRSINGLYNIINQQKSNVADNNKHNKPTTFAEILKENKNTLASKHQTVVYLENNEDTMITRQTLARLIQPAKEGIEMTDAKSLSKGKMIIDFKDHASKNKFDLLAKATKQLTTEPPRKLQPTIMLKGVRRDIDKESIPNMLLSFNYPITYYVETNKLDITKLVEIVSERKNFRSERLINYSISTDPKIRDIIINELNGKVILDYSLVHAEDLSPLRQCFRCLGYNHKAAVCQLKAEQQICFHCGLQHKFEECPNKSFSPTCVNCRKSGIKDNTQHNSLQIKFNINNRPHAQKVHIKFAQINCNKSPGAFQQFLAFCDKHKIDLAFISEPPIRKNIPNIDKKFRPMYATNAANQLSVISQHVSNPQQMSNNHHLISANQVSSVSQVSANQLVSASLESHNMQQVTNHYQVSSIQQTNNAFPVSSSPQILNFNHVQSESQMSTNHPASTVQQIDYLHVPYVQQPSSDQQQQNFNQFSSDQSSSIQQATNVQSSNDQPVSATHHPVRSCIIVFNPSISPVIISPLSNVDFLVVEINNFYILNHDWCVSDDVHNSDHRPIITSINNYNIASTTARTTVKWNTNNVNWTEWSSVIDGKFREFNINTSEINNIDDQQQLDLIISIFTNIIQQSCDQFCTKYIDKRTRCDNWHKDAQLQQIVTKQRHIYRKIRRCHNQPSLQRYKDTYQQLRQQYRLHLQKLKNDAFDNDINGEGPVSCYQKVSRLMKNNGHMIFKTIEGTSDPVQSTIKLVDTLFPSDDSNSDSEDQKLTRIGINRWLQKNVCVSAPSPITIQELHNAIIKFKDVN